MTDPNRHDTLPPSMDPDAGGMLAPPTSLGGILKRLGPGLIIAGSIVGSGELIATTKTGAQAGMSLLWLIIIGCLIKVFVQIELGRYTISHAETTLVALDRVPGPRLKVNWIVWFWLGMMLVGIGQLGGIVGGVGQSLALSLPITGDYADAIRMPSAGELKAYHQWDEHLLSEWDVRLSGTWQDRIEPTDAALPGLNQDESRWVRAVVRATAEKLERLQALDGAPRGDELIADVARLQAFESAGPADGVDQKEATDLLTRRDYDALSRQVRMRFEQANLALLRALPPKSTPSDSQVAAFNRLPPEQQQRLVRGHGILAQQLALLDADGGRSTEAMARVIGWVEAQAQLEQAEQRLAALRSADVPEPAASEQHQARLAVEDARIDASGAARSVKLRVDPPTRDDKYWAAVATLFTALLLYRGRYRMIQNVSLVLVVSFTFITIGNVISLQATERFAVPAAEFWRGLSFGLPEAAGGKNALATALATFGIIGVGASELISYPYWCLEKGYARFTGPNSPDPGWAERAKGWMRVMHYDAFLSMIVYTIATLAFFIMGSAVLYNEGRDPEGMRMVSTLATAYVPVFGEYARWLFLIGAVAVLYSTFLVASASHARTYTDSLKLFGLLDRHSQRKHDRSVGAFSVLLPMVCLAVYCSGIDPVEAILWAGAMQALLLPMIGLGALYFRYTRTDERLKPAAWWDVLLAVSCAGLLVAGAWSIFESPIRNTVLVVTVIGLLAAGIWSWQRRSTAAPPPS
ncbi:MAG TPA: divalent metal cation transporter [Planctomycetaceae bacterium]|nr:divalent metal cation transporter [Planctomycetaceae bacterium]